MDEIIRIQQAFARKAIAQPDHRFRDLYSLVWKPAFLNQALDLVLANQGSRSAGLDGVTKTDLKDPSYRADFIQDLSAELKARTFTPSPGRRVYIAKDNGKQRPLGILTLKDRTVQMVLKLLLEPIFEADFLDCSYGFRPGRRTMDCLVPLWRHIQPISKHYWVVEGDIRAYFDTICQSVLGGLLRHRLADPTILHLINDFLKAGVMEGQLFKRTDIGTQQGGILSPLLANWYLHQFDRWWWTNYGGLTRYQRRKHRRAGLGHPLLIRYADDFILLWNGDKAGAVALKEEASTFLIETLKLDLNPDKTLVTHVDDGFTFLGFDIRRYQGYHGKPILLIKPAQKNVTKLKAKIKALTKRNTSSEPVWYKVIQINQILRGWSAYYQHVNAKATFSKLDWWVLNRLFIWARKKHGRPAWHIINAKYRHYDPKGRINFVTHLTDGSPIWLYRMSDRPLRPYWVNWQRPAYLTGTITTSLDDDPDPLLEPIAYPAQEHDQVKLMALRRDQSTCQHCQQADRPVQVHHLIPKAQGGTDDLDNLITLCESCHRQIHRSLMVEQTD